jgi:uncharacterized membrane protein YjdF
MPRAADRHLADLAPLHPRQRRQGRTPLTPRRRDHFPAWPRRKYVRVLMTLFAIQFVLLGINPVSRGTWFAENALVVALAIPLFASYKRFRFSRLSYTLIFLFLALHQIGAHYTYSLVPYEALANRLGFSIDGFFGFQRNQYDRLVHFSCSCCSRIRCARSSCASPR